ncbi:hypothetical protein [Sporosarcina limicola]|uniref:Uncharacterized protein n=1 Tax=Sporosarcina limicola TaxID=34101 RepID=A0A927RGJ0_9BACL|nr:hypothetical protein [Sporosarcina limicola]MBE1556562.1 hypothetical protein [Sporosarcina limicola]
MKKIISILLIFSLIFLVSSNSVDAYNFWTNKAKLTKPIDGGQYYVSHSKVGTTEYLAPVSGAVLDWNRKAYTNKVDVNFTRTTSRASTAADF